MAIAEQPATVDPLAPERNLAEAFLLGLALWTSVRVVFLDPLPLSVDVLLGPAWAVIWSVTLFAGSVLALTGMYWPGRTLTAASLHELGYAAFSPASLARAVALLGVGRPEDSAIMIVFAVISLGRLLQIERRINRYYPAGMATWLRRSLRRWRHG